MQNVSYRELVSLQKRKIGITHTHTQKKRASREPLAGDKKSYFGQRCCTWGCAAAAGGWGGCAGVSAGGDSSKARGRALCEDVGQGTAVCVSVVSCDSLSVSLYVSSLCIYVSSLCIYVLSLCIYVSCIYVLSLSIYVSSLCIYVISMYLCFISMYLCFISLYLCHLYVPMFHQIIPKYLGGITSWSARADAASGSPHRKTTHPRTASQPRCRHVQIPREAGLYAIIIKRVCVSCTLHVCKCVFKHAYISVCIMY